MYIICLALASVFFTCDDIDELRKEVDEKYQNYLLSSFNELEASWSRCEDASSIYFDSSSKKTTITYFNGYRKIVQRHYRDLGCSGDDMGSIIQTREYAVEGPAEIDPTVKKKKAYFSKTAINWVIFTHPDSVISANANGAFGKNDWALNATKLIKYWIQIDGTSQLSALLILYSQGWDLWVRDYYEVNGNTLTIYDKNTANPESNQYPAAVSGGEDYTRQ